MHWQMHWPSWWKLWPWGYYVDDVNYPIRDYVFGFGAFQARIRRMR